MAFSGRDLHRTASSSISSSLDGVRFCLSESYKPPAKVTLPINFEIGNPTEVLFMEYDFSVEEGVLAWTNQQKQAEKALDNVETQKVANTLEQFMQQVPETDCTEPVNQNAVPSDSGVSSSNTQSQASAESQPPATTAPTNPFYAAMNSNGILVPTPIMIPKSDGNSPAIKTAPVSNKFNVADFEREADPFDNLELQTIDDMEELNKVLTGVQSPPQTSDTTAKANVGGPYQATAVSCDTAPPPVPPRNPVHNYENMNILRNVEYPDIFNAGPSHSPEINSATLPVATSAAHPLVNHSTQPVANPAAQPVANPAAPPLVNHSGQPVPNPASQFTNHLNSAALGPATNLPPLPSSKYLIQQPADSGRLVVDLSSKRVGYSPGQSDGSPIKSARSTPDIGQLVTREGQRPSKTYTPPPQMPYHTPVPPQAPHRHSPQPITNSDTKNQYRPSSSSAPNSRSSTPVANSSSQCLLPNPYAALSAEGRHFVDTLTVMGFPQARTARAVASIGQDDKEIVDFLCKVNRLSDKGYSPDDAEMALNAFKHDEQKAQEYLRLLGQFQELGFDKGKIREALVASELDEEKTLDVLTGT